MGDKELTQEETDWLSRYWGVPEGGTDDWGIACNAHSHFQWAEKMKREGKRYMPQAYYDELYAKVVCE